MTLREINLFAAGVLLGVAASCTTWLGVAVFSVQAAVQLCVAFWVSEPKATAHE